jgi:hypothetical protein
VPPDHYTLAKKPEIKILEQHLGNKPVRLIAAAGRLASSQRRSRPRAIPNRP